MECYICINRTDEISPCKCKITVHNSCLIKFLRIQNTDMQNTGIQRDIYCGICKGAYNRKDNNGIFMYDVNLNGNIVLYENNDDKLEHRLIEISDFMGSLLLMEDVQTGIDKTYEDIRIINKINKMNNELITLVCESRRYILPDIPNLKEKFLYGNPDTWERIITILKCNRRISGLIRNQNRFQ